MHPPFYPVALYQSGTPFHCAQNGSGLSLSYTAVYEVWIGYCRIDKFCSSVFVPVRIIWKRYFIPGCRVQGLVSAQRSHTARQKKRHTDPSWQDPPRFKKREQTDPPHFSSNRERPLKLSNTEKGPLKVSNTEWDLSPSDKDRFSPLSWPTTWPKVTQGKINATLFNLSSWPGSSYP